MADLNAIEMMERAGEAIPMSGIAWATGSALLFRFSKAITATAVPGFSSDFLQLLTRSRKITVKDYAAVFVAQMDRLFKFRSERFISNDIYVPSAARSVAASMATIFSVMVLLTICGFDVWKEITQFLSGESITVAVAERFQLANPNSLHSLHFSMALVVSGVALTVNLCADYLSVTQTRHFIQKSRSSSIPGFAVILLMDLIASIVILILSMVLGVFVTSILFYLFDFYPWSTLGEYLGRFFVPTVAVSLSVAHDALAPLVGRPEISSDVMDFLGQWTGYPLAYPSPKYIFLTWICSSLLSSAWLWLNISAIILAKLVSLTPATAKALIRWTKAKDDPDRLVATFIVLVWSIFWLFSLLSSID